MEDKTFELLTKMYSEFSHRFEEVKSDILNVKSDIQNVKSDIQNVKSDIRNVKSDIRNVKSDVQTISNQVVKLENDLKPKIEFALEGYQAVSERLTRLEEKIDILTLKVENHDVQIAILKNRKKATK